ncbi:MAG: signal peptidase I [Tumebacillaceae bacterium]
MFSFLKKKWLRDTLNWCGVIVLAVLINVLLRDHVFAITKIDGYSMMPTLENNERVYLNRLAYLNDQPKRGDIVVFPDPHDDRDLVKRVIGLPGDDIQIQDGKLYINKQVQIEPYIDAVTPNFHETAVAPGFMFVMGDNRHPLASMDSRDPHIGMIPIQSVKGRVDLVLYPSPHVLSK